MGKQAVRIPLVEPHEPPVQSSKLFSRDLLQFGIHGIAADNFKVLAVQIAFPHELQTQPNQFVVVVPCDAVATFRRSRGAPFHFRAARFMVVSVFWKLLGTPRIAS